MAGQGSGARSASTSTNVSIARVDHGADAGSADPLALADPALAALAGAAIGGRGHATWRGRTAHSRDPDGRSAAQGAGILDRREQAVGAPLLSPPRGAYIGAVAQPPSAPELTPRPWPFVIRTKVGIMVRQARSG
jgi:hypothetical protein